MKREHNISYASVYTALKNERLVSGIRMALWLATGWGTTQHLKGGDEGVRETSDLRYIWKL